MGKAKICVILFVLLKFLSGCKEYQKDFTFTRTVLEVQDEEEILVMEEYGSEDEGGRDGNVYETLAKKIEQYNAGDRLGVTVFSNTVAEVWDPEYMKFKIEPAGE